MYNAPVILVLARYHILWNLITFIYCMTIILNCGTNSHFLQIYENVPRALPHLHQLSEAVGSLSCCVTQPLALSFRAICGLENKASEPSL